MVRNRFTASLAVLTLLFSLTLQSRAVKLFRAPVTYNTGGSGADSLALADVNGDGKLDMVVANPCDVVHDCNGLVGVLLGNGDGTFQPVKTYLTGGLVASAVAVADVNGDGKPDLLVANECTPSDNCHDFISSVGVLLGNGNGTFQPAQTFLTDGQQARAIAVADVNADHKPDLIVLNRFATLWNPTGSVAVLAGNGDGTFQSPVLTSGVGNDPRGMALGDANGDGKVDVFLPYACLSPSCGNGTGVWVFLGNGDGTFQAAHGYDSGSADSASSIATADLNGDSKLDLLVSTTCLNQCAQAAIAVFLGLGDGTFQGPQRYALVGPSGDAIAAADIDRDGKSDLLVVGCPAGKTCGRGIVNLLRGNGDGTFQAAQTFATGGRSPGSIVVADVNGDFKPDLLIANAYANGQTSGPGEIGVLFGTTRFPSATSVTSNPNPSVQGQAVTFTATVKSNGWIAPTGSVAFKNGTAGIGTAKLVGGVATLTRSNLPVGHLTITAIYSGDAQNAQSVAVIIQVVN